MKTEGMEGIYSKIANELNLIIPDDWEKLYLHSEIEHSSIESYFYFKVNENASYVYGFDIPEKFNVNKEDFLEQFLLINDYIEELWNEFKVNQQPLWSNLTFYLESNGKFDIKYGYENLTESAFDDYERQIIWKYKILGEMPVDEYDKAIIKRFRDK
ncbi:immunity protein YezG family protein [Listeria kieliensis]